MFHALSALALISTLSIHDDLSVRVAHGTFNDKIFDFSWSFTAAGHVDPESLLFSLDTLEHSVPVGGFEYAFPGVPESYSWTWGTWALVPLQAAHLDAGEHAYQMFEPVTLGELTISSMGTRSVTVTPRLEIGCRQDLSSCDTYMLLGSYSSPSLQGGVDLMINPMADLADTLPEPSTLALLLACITAAACRRGARPCP